MKKFEKLSPSKFTSFEECPYKYILDSEPLQGKKRGKRQFNKHTFLGLLIHEVIEAFILSKKEGEAFDFNSVWDFKFNSELKKYVFPEVYSDVVKEYVKYWVPFYVVKKSKVERFLNDFTFEYEEYFPEFVVDSETISGKIDLLEKSSESIQITDFKSGAIFKSKGFGRGGPKPLYVDQLTTYALATSEMMQVQGKTFRVKLQGINLDQQYEKLITNEILVNQKRRIIALLTDVNESIENKTEKSLAKPKPSVCKYCDHFLSCGKLHNKLVKYPLKWKDYVLIRQIDAEFDANTLEITIVANERVLSVMNIPKEEFKKVKRLVEIGKPQLLTGLFTYGEGNVRKWTSFSSYHSIE
jgi:hypothetical protein